MLLATAGDETEKFNLLIEFDKMTFFCREYLISRAGGTVGKCTKLRRGSEKSIFSASFPGRGGGEKFFTDDLLLGGPKNNFPLGYGESAIGIPIDLAKKSLRALIIEA